MDKKWVFSGLVIIFIAASLFFWLPADAQEECPVGKKCIFNYAGTLMLQATKGDIELFTLGDSKDGGNIKLDISGFKSASNIFLKTQESGESNIYLNYFAPDHYGLAVTANGGLYHDSFAVLVADGGYYDINIDGISKGLSLIRSEVTPGQIDSSRQLFTASGDYNYWGSANPTIGLSSLYADNMYGLFGQLAFIRSGDIKDGGVRQYLQYRFNDIDSPSNWGQWVEMCDNSNNCRNFLNILDETSNGSLLVYQDPDLLMDAGLKINDPSALANCDALNTSGGVIGCGSGGTGGGVSGAGTINYIPKWSSASSLANSTIFDNGNVGIGDSAPNNKLTVNGTISATIFKNSALNNCSNGLIANSTGEINCRSTSFVTTDQYWTGTATNLVSSTARASLGLGSLATLSAVSGGTAGTISDGTITNADINASAAIAASKIQYGTYFINSAGTSGQVWTSDGSGAGSWAALAAGSGGGVAGSGTINYLPKWSNTSTLANSLIYDNGTNVGIGTDNPGAKLEVNGNIKTKVDNALPNIVLDSSSAGDNWTSQGAYISLGESGSLGAAALHLTYNGSGSSYIGSGAVTNGVPAQSYFRFSYSSKMIYTNSVLQVASSGPSYFSGNLGIGTTSPAYKLSVVGTGYFSNPVIVGTPTQDDHATTKAYVDGQQIAWSRINNFPTACSAGQVVTGIGSALTCTTTASVAYTAGNGLNLSGNAFSLAASGSANYVTRWTSTNQLGYGKIFDNNTSVGINTASPSANANLQINAANNFEALRLVSALAYSPLNIRNNANDADIFRVDQAGSLAVGSIPWARLTSFPTTACGTNQFVTGFNTSGGFNCATPSTNSHDLVTLTNIGSTANAKGASLSGQVLTLQPASASFGGVVTTGTQTFAGSKTFNSQIIGNINGNAATANALSANGGNCNAGYYPLGVDEKGKAEDCTLITGGGTYTADGNGLELVGNSFRLELNGTTLSTSSAGLRVNAIGSAEISDGSIVNADISGLTAIAWNKISKVGSNLTDLATRSHASLTNLTNDDHTQYVLSAGRATSQSIKGSTAANNTLTLQGNSAASGNASTSINMSFKVGNGGGTNAMTILNNGNIGINRTNPTQKLHVKGNIDSYVDESDTGSIGFSIIDTFDTSGGQTAHYGLTRNSFGLNTIALSGYAGLGLFTGGSERLRIDSSGNVGIGTSSLSNGKLTVAGNLSVTGSLKIGATDVITSGRLIQSANGAASTPAFSFSGDTNTGIYSGGTDILKFSTNSNDRMTILANGNVGVSTTAPADKFHVDGGGIMVSSGSNNIHIYNASGNALINYDTSDSGAKLIIRKFDEDMMTFASGPEVTIGDGGNSKLNVGTVDPIYTIGGQKYATYMAGMTGVKEETSGALVLNKQSAGLFMAKLDFQKAPEGSDIWLFGRTTNLIDNQEHFDQTSCLLTPNFAGQTWYEKDWDGRSINIFARPDNINRASIEVSYRLTAPRFDQKNWTNYSDSQHSGFNLDELLK